MDTSRHDTFIWAILGGGVGTALATLVLPAWLPALAASLTNGSAYWLLARTGGFIAYILLWLSVAFGLLLSSRAARSWPGMRQANTVHRSVSLLALIYTFFHALILLGDRYIAFDLRSLLLPFASVAYRPLAVGLGQLSAYLLMIVALSSYVRQHIGTKTWRALHYIAFILYFLVTAHGLLAGTDSGEPWALALYAGTGILTYALTIYRVLVSASGVPSPQLAH